ncbi:MAG TPA: hypothetical protein VL326_02935 [Kofleriaceae bacterium]|nr:hypothetical protein [Kofleriaceae bacterium]
MRSLCLVVFMVAACGSVSNHEDAGVDTVPPGSATLALEKTTEWVAQGDSTAINFTITRGSSVTGALTVHVANLPTGVTAADVAVAAGATTGTITFNADTSSTAGATTNVDVTLSDTAMMFDTRPFGVFVAGAHGAIDTTFGTTGKLAVPLPDPVVPAVSGNSTVRAVAQYPASAGANAGKIVVAVELDTTGTATTTWKSALVRLNNDGTLDTTFGTAGSMLLTGTNTNRFWPVGIALDSQGRINVAMMHWVPNGNCNAYVTRVTAAGVKDTGWTDYDDIPPGGYCGSMTGITSIAGDKVVALGTWNIADTSQRPVLMQFNSDGTQDSAAFGGAFYVKLGNPDLTNAKQTWISYRITHDSAGRLLLAGLKCNGGWNAAYSACESVIGRVTAAGAWDTTFGTAVGGNHGYSSLTFGTTASAPQGFQGLLLDSAGNIFTSGWSEDYTTATLAKWSGTDGAIDTTFGTSGRVSPVLVTGGTVQELNDLALDSTGRIVGLGYAVSGGPLVVTTRYSATGTIDSGFATAGVATAMAAGVSPYGAIATDGRIIVVGGTPRGGSNPGTDLAVWRVWP